MSRDPHRPARRLADARGQATVELVALLPLLAVLGLAAWQVAATVHTMWRTTVATRAAARAHALGQDPQRTVNRLLPRGFDDDARVRTTADGEVEVQVPLDAVTGGRLTTFTSTARFAPQ